MNLPKATHSGEVTIGNIKLPCFVLEDGRRLLSQRKMLVTLGRSPKQKGRGGGADELPPFLAQINLKPFINKNLRLPTTPVKFDYEKTVVFGYEAELLPAVCEIYLQARDAGVLYQSQMHIAEQADLLVRGFAHVGIIALIDEATGYQEVRDRKALELILEEYLRPYTARWARRFPDEFYKEIFRLQDWKWQGMQINRPQVVGQFTNDLVYSRLADGLLKKLERLNPKNDKGERSCRHHQWLTEHFGIPELHEHIIGVIAIMRSVQHHNPKRAWTEFKRRLQRAYPKQNTNFDLDFDE